MKINPGSSIGVLEGHFDKVSYISEEGDSEQLVRVALSHLPGAMAKFAAKNQDYGDTAYNLGAKGQFADINRKFYKLKRSLWEDETLEFESVEEILEDMLGHILLTLDFLREGETK